MVRFGYADLGQLINSVAVGRSPRLRLMDDLYTWGDVAKALKPMARGAQVALARAIGMDPSYLSRELRDGKGELKVTQAQEIASAIDKLRNGENAETPPKAAARKSPTRLPVYGYAAAGGEDRFVINEGEIIDEIELPMGMSVGPGEYFVVIASGSSMEPRIFSGEPQVVRKDYPASHGKDAVIEFTDGTAVIKIYRGRRDGRVFAEQFNPPKILDFDATTVKQVYPVVFSL